jgi:hypothetical protein
MIPNSLIKTAFYHPRNSTPLVCKVRLAANQASLPALLQVMPNSKSATHPNGTHYLLKSLSPTAKNTEYTPLAGLVRWTRPALR